MKEIKVTEKEKDLIETLRIFRKLKGDQFLDLQFYIRELFEQLLIDDEADGNDIETL
jgi:hypothetical protein